MHHGGWVENMNRKCITRWPALGPLRSLTPAVRKPTNPGNGAFGKDETEVQKLEPLVIYGEARFIKQESADHVITAVQRQVWKSENRLPRAVAHLHRRCTVFMRCQRGNAHPLDCSIMKPM